MATNKRENEEEDEVAQKRAKVEEDSENGGDDAPFVSRRQFTICPSKTIDRIFIEKLSGSELTTVKQMTFKFLFLF